MIDRSCALYNYRPVFRVGAVCRFSSGRSDRSQTEAVSSPSAQNGRRHVDYLIPPPADAFRRQLPGCRLHLAEHHHHVITRHCYVLIRV